MTVHQLADARTAVVHSAPRSGRALVTPSGSLTGETFGVARHTKSRAAPSARGLVETPFFVDWMTVSQEHAQPLPVVSAGVVWSAGPDGQVEWKTTKRVEFKGSHETTVNVKCDGHRVEFSGNVSRFCRPDNLFGFDLWECLGRVNSILNAYGLPPFTPGKRIELTRRDGDADYRYSGARISRLDLTANFEAGNAENAHAFMAWLGSQHAGRQSGKTLGQGETVSFGGGKGSRQYWKAYIKHLDVARHGGEGTEVYEHCRAVGIVRFEGTVRTKWLTDNGCAWLGDYEKGNAMGKLIQLYEEKAAVLGRAERCTDDLDHLPRHFRATARDYLAGGDCKATMSKASFYKHRRELLPYGIDIAIRNVKPFQPRVRVINLRPAAMPAWYSLAA